MSYKNVSLRSKGVKYIHGVDVDLHIVIFSLSFYIIKDYICILPQFIISIRLDHFLLKLLSLL